METKTSIEEKTLFFHGKSADGRRFTLAAKFVDDALLLGIAVCSKTDQFIKHVGRKKAEGRLFSYNFKGCTISSLYSEKFFEEYATELGLVQDWFVGKELKVFITVSHKIEAMTFKEIKTLFNFLY